MQIIFLSGTTCVWLAQNVNKFLVRHKKFEPAQKILGPVKGQGTSFSDLKSKEVYKKMSVLKVVHFFRYCLQNFFSGPYFIYFTGRRMVRFSTENETWKILDKKKLVKSGEPFSLTVPYLFCTVLLLTHGPNMAGFQTTQILPFWTTRPCPTILRRSRLRLPHFR